MELKEKTIVLRQLTASEGMYLTQAYETEERVYVKSLHLGQGELVDNWREATEEEREAYEKQREVEMVYEVATPNDDEL